MSVSEKTIGQLPALSRDVADTDLIAIDDGTTTYKVSVHDYEATAASAAAGYATAAANSADEAKGYKNTAQQAVSDVGTQVTAAQNYANAASGSATSAYNYADAASGSATTAAGHATSAGTSASEANGYATVASQKASDASDEAARAKSWADYPNASGGYGDATHNAHYFADIAAAAAGGGVVSFNGRGGAVVSVDGDYSADMITYDNTASGMTADDVKEALDEVAGDIGTINNSLADKQPKTLATARTIGGTSRTTVEDALGALTDSAYLEDSLTSSSAVKALTAKQGKALKDEADKFFVLANNSLSFNSTTKIATVSDARVTASTYAMVYFTDATLSDATDAGIVVDTISGAVQFTATTLPTNTLVCDIVCKKA